MKKPFLILAVIIFCSAFICKTVPVPQSRDISIAFYNIDNLFDNVNDTHHDDDDFTPAGKYKWTNSRYNEKLGNMEKVISKIVNGKLPDILGVCELESRKALEDLLNTGSLKNKYAFAHFESPDERGIDVALIFSKEKFKLIQSRAIPVTLSKDSADKTRDILFAELYAKDAKDTLRFIVCHFPSRREGKCQSENNRIDAALAIKNFTDKNLDLSTQNVIIMGDFNDEPWDKSVYRTIGAQNISKATDSSLLLNLMWGFQKQKRGSYKYKGNMDMLDQIIISKSLNNKQGLDYVYNSVNIFDEEWLKQTGKYSGYPLRTFGGNNWLNGYSDHFAVYIKLQY